MQVVIFVYITLEVGLTNRLFEVATYNDDFKFHSLNVPRKYVIVGDFPMMIVKSYDLSWSKYVKNVCVILSEV